VPSRVITALIGWMGAIVRAITGPPARAIRGSARRVADPARQVREYFSSERNTLRQAFTAIVIASMTSLLAGLTLAAMDARIGEVAGLFVLNPVSIGMRGKIFGALAARLVTTIHSGLFEVSRAKGGILQQNIYAATLLTISTSVTMAVLARGVTGLFDVDTVSVWDFIVIALVGGLLSSAVVLAVTVYLSVKSFEKGWDLDSVGAPLITAIGDVVTLPLLLVSSYLIEIDHFTFAAGLLALAAGVVSLVRGWTSVQPLVQRIVRESFPVLVIAIVLDVLAGAVVEPRMAEVFLPFPGLLIVIPGFLENTGALGSILAARLGSKLHLGALTAKAKPDPVALLDGSIVIALGMTVYTLTGITAFGLAELLGLAHPGIIDMAGATIVGGLIATVLAAVIGYYAATTTYRFGFDPDNHTIPLVTSGMDLLGVTCLVLSLVMFGVA
jgi:mgtE-like transporter